MKLPEAIILAGGFGTRLQRIVSDLPKAMAPVKGRPFLEYLLDYLQEQGITDVILSVGHLRDALMNHFGSGYRGIRIRYYVEEEPLGTGGGIRLAMWKVNDARAFAMNGDSLFLTDLRGLMEQHMKTEADVTIALRQAQDTHRYGRVTAGRNNRITVFSEKEATGSGGYINGGIYLVEKQFLLNPKFRGKFSIERDCFALMTNDSRIFGFPSTGYFLDIGIPEDYQRAQYEFTQFDHR